MPLVGSGGSWGGALGGHCGHDAQKGGGEPVFWAPFGGHLGTLGVTLGRHFETFFVSVMKNTQSVILTTLPRASPVFEVRWVAF